MNFFFLTMTETIISQNVDLSFWVTLNANISSDLVAFVLRNKTTLKMETARPSETFLPKHKATSYRNPLDYIIYQLPSKKLWEFCLLLKEQVNLWKTVSPQTLTDDTELTVIVWQLFLTDNLEASLNNTHIDIFTFL
jgi:hypothetical protein